MTDRVFVDSNIWVYLFTDNAGDRNFEKRGAALEFISQHRANSRFVISYQVVNEVCNVLKKKEYTEPELRRVADDMTGLCEVCGYSREIFFLASELRERHSFSYWDSQIVASALVSDCGVLASEDMRDGLVIGNMIISNVLS